MKKLQNILDGNGMAPAYAWRLGSVLESGHSEQLKAAGSLCVEVVAVGMLTRASHTRELELKRETRSCTSPAAVSQREGEVNTPAFIFYSLDAGDTRVSKADTVPTSLTEEEAHRACGRHCLLCSFYRLIHYPSSQPLGGGGTLSPLPL